VGKGVRLAGSCSGNNEQRPVIIDCGSADAMFDGTPLVGVEFGEIDHGVMRIGLPRVTHHKSCSSFVRNRDRHWPTLMPPNLTTDWPILITR
jgi:hypothetical protein